MERMYLLEIFLDKVTVVEDNKDARTDKKLITKIKFGPKVEFIIKEAPLAENKKVEDIIEHDEKGRKKWTRSIKVGKSFLFSSYPDTLAMDLSKFPLEIEIWNDDDQERNIFVGTASMFWDTEFLNMLRESATVCDYVEPLSIKQRATLSGECCKPQIGEVQVILRLSVMGDSIVTDFQELIDDPKTIVFRTDKASSTFSCKRIEGDNSNFTMVGSIYETKNSEDPNLNRKMLVCTELQSCGMDVEGTDYVCDHKEKKKYPIDKIRLGDIAGPCGNTSCQLAQKVRAYLRNLDSYKKSATGVVNSKNKSNKVCGACECKDDRHHREECPTHEERRKMRKSDKAVCCGGQSKLDHTCTDEGDVVVPRCNNCKKTKERRGTSDDKLDSTLAYLIRLNEESDYDSFLNEPPMKLACCRVSNSNKTKRGYELNY